MAVPLQNTQSWLEWRKERIGASEAPIIMGLDKYTTPLKLYNQKKGIEPNNFKSAAMQRGHDLEPAAREWYYHETGQRIHPTVIVSEIYPWMHASIDGMSFDGEVAVEIKCPGKAMLDEIERNGVPDNYFCQCQHQMFVASLDEVDLVVFDGVKGKIYKVYRDEKFIFKMLDKEIEFYDCLKNNTPPAASKERVSYEPIETDEWASLMQTIKDCGDRIKRDQEILDLAKDRAKEIAGGRNLKGHGLYITYGSRKGNVNYKAIPELKGVDLEKYRAESIEVVTIGLE